MCIPSLKILFHIGFTMFSSRCSETWKMRSLIIGRSNGSANSWNNWNIELRQSSGVDHTGGAGGYLGNTVEPLGQELDFGTPLAGFVDAREQEVKQLELYLSDLELLL